MATVDLALPPGRIFVTNADGEEFLPLGAAYADALEDSAHARIQGETAEDDPDVWGTLGMLHPADTEDAYGRKYSMRSWRGALRFSAMGNLHSTADESGEATMEEILDVYGGRHDEINRGPRRKVIERYISFEDAEYGDYPSVFSWDEVPRLRLTLFLEPSQGALVFYQHMDDGPLVSGGRGDGTSVQYVQPKPTKTGSHAFDVGPHPDHDCSTRDRLHYEIPVLPRESFEEEGSDEERMLLRRAARPSGGKFVIKVLVFQRGNSTSLQILRRLVDKLAVERYALLKWSREDGCFTPTSSSKVSRASGRTLLFLHGTFSSTEGAFGELTAEHDASWTGRLAKTDRYDQILAFDHSTILHGTEENAAILRDHLGGPLDNPCDVLTHSRGGLLARQLALYEPGLLVRRAALVSSANGVGYFTAARKVAKFLSVLKSILKGTGRPVGAFVTGIAQHSATFFVNLPGCRVMTPGAPELQRLIAEAWPHPHPAPTFLPVVGDYDRSLVEGERLLRRLTMNGLDLVIKLFLGRYHDWVVGTPEQSILSPGVPAAGYDAQKFLQHMVPARHTRYYGIPQVRNLLWSFLH